MSPPQGHKKKEGLHTEVAAARRAFQEGRFQDAQHHLAQAERMGAPAKQVSDLSRAMLRGHQSQQYIRSSRRWGFWSGVLGYLLVSTRQPLEWTAPIWIFLAFLFVPGLIGLIVSLRQGPGPDMRIRFWVAFRAAAWTMGIYTAIMLLIIGERLGGDSASAGGHLLAGTLTTLFFAILAGSVGGVVGILFGYRPKKEEKHEPAS